MVTKMADKIGLNREIAILDQILGFWRPIFYELNISKAKYQTILLQVICCVPW